MENLFSMERPYTVLEINSFVREAINQAFPEYVWICGEIQDLRDRQHVNFNLVEKQAQGDSIVAQAKAVIFENIKYKIYERLKGSGLGALKSDIEVKLLCKVDFFPKNGSFSLRVMDIDPVYTLGKVAQNRQKIIEELKKEGLIDKNKLKTLPLVPLSIGLITSVGSAAYHDFTNELKISGFGFKVFAFDTFVQGKAVEKGVVKALKFFQELNQELDVIIITRGGGSTADLAWFDSKNIALSIASCRYPIISALGHQINTTVTDLVAHTSVKTPTASAQFLVEAVSDFKQKTQEIAQEVVSWAQNLIELKKSNLQNTTMRLDSGLAVYFRELRERLIEIKHSATGYFKMALSSQKQKLKSDLLTLTNDTNKFFKNCKDFVQYREDKISLLDPRQVLKRGYSVTLKAGKSLKSIKAVEKGDEITTVLYDGQLISRITENTKT